LPAANVVVLLVGALPQGDVPATTATPNAATPLPPPTSVLRPESNDGIWIGYMGQRWVSAGPAIPFEDVEFMRIGQYAGFPVFSRTRVKEDVIYLPTRTGLVAPYRLKK
jgi:hypothetical protein